MALLSGRTANILDAELLALAETFHFGGNPRNEEHFGRQKDRSVEVHYRQGITVRKPILLPELRGQRERPALSYLNRDIRDHSAIDLISFSGGGVSSECQSQIIGLVKIAGILGLVGAVLSLICGVYLVLVAGMLCGLAAAWNTGGAPSGDNRSLVSCSAAEGAAP